VPAIAFSAAVKDELARIVTAEDCCARAELWGLLRTAGRIAADERGQVALVIRTQYAIVARKAYRLVRVVLGLKAEIDARKRQQLDKATYFEVRTAGPDVAGALAGAGFTDVNGEPRAGDELRECCRRAFVRGAFLGSGFILDPARGYHWEVVLRDRPTARFVRRLLATEGITAGLARRRHEYVVYLKDAEGIAAWLSVTGAHQALLSMENARIYKEIKNRVNRLVNCETANLGRTINAGVEQQEAIRFIDATKGVSSLPESLRAVAVLRLANPEATLDELGTMLKPPLGKSGVNHRLRQIRDLALALGWQAPTGQGLGLADPHRQHRQ